jgi:hypothetical protein
MSKAGNWDDNHLPATLGVAFGIVTFWVFWVATKADFFHYDDQDDVTANSEVPAGLTPYGIWWSFTTFHARNWHPLTWISLMLDANLCGITAFRFQLAILFSMQSLFR